MSKPKRICVIGAGPSGMSVLYQYYKLKEQGNQIPEIVCYDKQSDWGGLWLYSWETGIDQHGEPVHGSMYKGLFVKAPKECFEIPDYTFKDHFKKPIPSYTPREVLYDYLKGRWSKYNLRQWIHFNHVVRNVVYNDDTDDFTVVVHNLTENKDLPAETFDYVIVASGHYSVPYIPHFDGIETFPGRVIHSHDFRNAVQFKNQTILAVGAKYSGEDVAIQCLKYGAKRSIISYKTKPLGFKWPPGIEERPLITKIDGYDVHFQYGTSATVDSIILCTGYRHHFPFLEERLRLVTTNVLYPAGLYKGVVWIGNTKLLYVTPQDEIYTFTMFDVQAKWLLDYITGVIKLPDKKTMEEDTMKWVERLKGVSTTYEAIDFQTDYVNQIAKEANYGYDVDISQMLHAWHDSRHAGSFEKYRDPCYVSKYTGQKAVLHRTPFFETFDYSLEGFIGK